MEHLLGLRPNFSHSFELGHCSSAFLQESFCTTSARKFVVYDEDSGSGGKDCDGAGQISSLTFLNFVIGSLSLAASLVSNENSNRNNNNNNNNDNNNNDNNVNIGNSNNNVNSQNQLMFLPMVGRSYSSARRQTRSVFWENREQLCDRHQQGTNWLSRCAIRSTEFFVRLESCQRQRRRDEQQLVDNCRRREVCDEKTFLSTVNDASESLVLDHLARGAAKISGIEFEEVQCGDIK